MPNAITSKGRVTVPKPVRDLLRITPGSSLAFEVAEDGRVYLRKVTGRAPATDPARRFAQLRGTATAGLSTEEIMALTRIAG